MSEECGTCSWLDVVKNSGLAVKNAISYALEKGHVTLPEDSVAHRLKICESCQYLNGARCRACGCFVELKAAFASESCPKNKWKKENEKT